MRKKGREEGRCGEIGVERRTCLRDCNIAHIRARCWHPPHGRCSLSIQRERPSSQLSSSSSRKIAPSRIASYSLLYLTRKPYQTECTRNYDIQSTATRACRDDFFPLLSSRERAIKQSALLKKRTDFPTDCRMQFYTCAFLMCAKRAREIIARWLRWKVVIK